MVWREDHARRAPQPCDGHHAVARRLQLDSPDRPFRKGGRNHSDRKAVDLASETARLPKRGTHASASANPIWRGEIRMRKIRAALRHSGTHASTDATSLRFRAMFLLIASLVALALLSVP